MCWSLIDSFRTVELVMFPQKLRGAALPSATSTRPSLSENTAWSDSWLGAVSRLMTVIVLPILEFA